RLPVGRPFRPHLLARHPRRVRESQVQGRRRPRARGLRPARQGRRTAGAGRRVGHRAQPGRLRLHLLLGRRLGAAGGDQVRRRRDPGRCQVASEGVSRDMDKYRIALSGDFRKADGSPTFPSFDLSPLTDDPRIEIAWVDPVDGVMPAEPLAGCHGLILLVPRFTAASIPPDYTLAFVARFGVGYDSVDVDACTDNAISLVITPDGVRRPVAVSVITFVLALSQ